MGVLKVDCSCGKRFTTEQIVILEKKATKDISVLYWTCPNCKNDYTIGKINKTIKKLQRKIRDLKETIAEKRRNGEGVEIELKNLKKYEKKHKSLMDNINGKGEKE